jgi:hypothetical protein
MALDGKKQIPQPDLRIIASPETTAKGAGAHDNQKNKTIDYQQIYLSYIQISKETLLNRVLETN